MSQGKDSHNGKSIDKAWSSLKKINRKRFKPGDSILFKRGDIWRGQLIPKTSGATGNYIYFGSYGEGEKPLILGSALKNIAKKMEKEKKQYMAG